MAMAMIVPVEEASKTLQLIQGGKLTPSASHLKTIALLPFLQIPFDFLSLLRQ